jgi:hypothetical protein
MDAADISGLVDWDALQEVHFSNCVQMRNTIPRTVVAGEPHLHLVVRMNNDMMDRDSNIMDDVDPLASLRNVLSKVSFEQLDSLIPGTSCDPPGMLEKVKRMCPHAVVEKVSYVEF